MKAVCLNSGGLDSLAVAKFLHSRGHRLHSLYVNLNVPHAVRAMDSARRIANHYAESYKVIRVTGEEWGMNITPQKFGVPFTAAVVHVLGAMYARKLGLDFLVSGLKDDAARENFELTFKGLLQASKVTPAVALSLPMRFLDLSEWVVGDSLAELTVSCNNRVPCGSCDKCEARKKIGVPERH